MDVLPSTSPRDLLQTCLLKKYKYPEFFLVLNMEKSACDAEIGVLNRAVDRAIIGKKVVINNTKDLFEFCQEKLILDEPYTKRNFFYVKADEISRNRPETNVKTIPNTRKLHNIENTTEPYLIKVRNLSCFCVNCVKGIFENCLNSDYVSAYQSKKITLLKTRCK